MFGMLMYPDHLQDWLDFGQGMLILLFLAPFDVANLFILGVSGHDLEKVWEQMSRGRGSIFPTFCVEFCLVFFFFSIAGIPNFVMVRLNYKCHVTLKGYEDKAWWHMSSGTIYSHTLIQTSLCQRVLRLYFEIINVFFMVGPLCHICCIGIRPWFGNCILWFDDYSLMQQIWPYWNKPSLKLGAG